MNNSLDLESGLAPVMPPPRKTSVLSLLKGTSSRRSIVVDKGEAKAKEKEDHREKEKKDEKDRSESRISILMGRKRGKVRSSLCNIFVGPTRLQTLSAAEPKPPKQVPLPPMQISAIPPSTSSRVGSIKVRESVSSMPPPPPRARVSGVASRSPANKTSDSSLRSGRHNLPPIAGSPSVGTVSSSQGTSAPNHPPLSGPTRSSVDTKETPTKIPRISSRMSTLQSPATTTLKPSGSIRSNRRLSLVVGGSLPGKSTQVDQSPSPHASFVSDFGVLEPTETPTQTKTQVVGSKERTSAQSSPASLSKAPRHSVVAPSLVTKSSSRDSTNGLRKTSAPAAAGSASTSTSLAPTDNHGLSSRFPGLSPSKSLKLLSPKISLAATKSSPTISSITPSTPGGSARQSISTPSPAPSSADDEEILADEEMAQYIKRQQARKLAAGAKKEELDELLRFPEPLPPVPSSTPTCEPIVDI